MKLKDGYMLQELAGQWVVLPYGDSCNDFTGILTLNEPGKLLWEALEAGGDKEALVKALTAEYDVSAQQASVDVDEFLQNLSSVGCLTL